MADGPGDREKPNLSKRKLLTGAAGIFASGFGIGIWGGYTRRRGELGRQNMEQLPSQDKKDPVKQYLSDFKTILLNNLNARRNMEIFEFIDGLSSRSEAEIAAHLRFEEKLRDNGEITRRYDFSFRGYGVNPYYDIHTLTDLNSNGESLSLEMQFFIDRESGIIPGSKSDPSRTNPFTADDLLDMASTILKEPPEAKQWAVGDAEENGSQHDFIRYKSRYDKFEKEIMINKYGIVWVKSRILAWP